MTIRMNFSGVKSVIDPLRFVETRLVSVVARLARPSMAGSWEGLVVFWSVLGWPVVV